MRTLLRRDPNFVDGTALLATLRWSQGDVAGATTAYASLCDTPIWCETYASDAAVLGRWTLTLTPTLTLTLILTLTLTPTPTLTLTLTLTRS